MIRAENRELRQVGGSLAVNLPSEVVKIMKLEKGQEIEISFDPAKNKIILEVKK